MTNAFLHGKVIYYIAVIITKSVTGCHHRNDITLQFPYPNSSDPSNKHLHVHPRSCPEYFTQNNP